MTIQEMIDESSGLDPIYVAPGYYEERIVLNKPVALISPEKWSAKIIGSIDIQDESASIIGFTIFYLKHDDFAIYIPKDHRGIVSGNCVVGGFRHAPTP